MQDADAKSRRGIGRMEGRGEINVKQRNSLTFQHFAAKFKMKIVYTFLLHTALTKCAYLLVMSNRSFAFVFLLTSPKKSNLFVFETKLTKTKTFSFRSKFFGLLNSNILLLLKKSWNTSKSLGFVPKFLEKIEKFCFCKKKSWNTSKSFGFVPKFLEKIETFHFRFWNPSKGFGFVSYQNFCAFVSISVKIWIH
jgi:hypothetical protein